MKQNREVGGEEVVADEAKQESMRGRRSMRRSKTGKYEGEKKYEKKQNREI